jgi:hypothetical protein
MGTLDYVAPEQADDPQGTDIRSDIYSLGCTLYQVLTGQVPFPGGDAPSKMKRLQAEEPLPLDQMRPEVPKKLAAVVGRMMGKRPADRYQTPAEVAAALVPFVAAPRPSRLRPRRKLLAVAAAALVLMMTAGAATIIRLPSGGDREIVIETDDPNIEVIVKGERIVRIVDPKTDKVYKLDRQNLTLSRANDPDGLSVVLDGARPITLKRNGQRIAVLRLVTRRDTGAGADAESEAPAPRQPTAVPRLTPFRHITWSEGQANRTAISAAGRYILAIRRNVGPAWAHVRVWESRTGKLVFDRDTALARFTPDGTKLITCDRWNDVHIYDAGYGKGAPQI